ncbi:hypothetical protein Q5762_22260 [Streptomyces sp. P9(2023)]|uniref:hypothetical protein n=1 Tax=Streptomyces sp. P9(2023) TaxID=3064394 RepID=UPI0028F45CAD|nr:hypothetical protein [Streptomyces sp. P9(2023)]MDT9691021.1 hypothetical protein [Streptomyces sp. P9(2023)]
MAAHAAVPTRRHLSTHGWGLPVTLGLAYGIYAAAIQRSGGVITWGQVVLGLVSGIVLAGAVYALRQWGGVLPRELRAAAWAALAGGAVGFLFSLSDASVLSGAILGLVVAAGTFVTAFYLFYTHEPATPPLPARRTSKPPARPSP